MLLCVRFLWWVWLAVMGMFVGVLGCGSRYEPAPQAGGEAPAAASAATSPSSTPAESAAKQAAPSEVSGASDKKVQESGGGLFRAFFEPLLSASGSGTPAGQAAAAQSGSAKPGDVAAARGGSGSGSAGASAGQSASPSPPGTAAAAPTAPASGSIPGQAPSSNPSAGSEQLSALPGAGGPPFGRTLFNQWQLGQRVDLISLLNRSQEMIGPRWRVEPASIVSPDPAEFSDATVRSVLLMPCTVPSEFRWTVVAERLSGRESLNLFFALPHNRRTMVILEGFGSQASGLNLLDNTTADSNASTYRGQLFFPGKPTTIALVVRRNAVQVTCDGKDIIDFRGDETRMSLDQRIWGMIPFNRIGLAIYGPSVFRISKLELEPLSTEIVGPPGMPFSYSGPRAAFLAPGGPPASRFGRPMRPPGGRPDLAGGGGAQRGSVPGPSMPPARVPRPGPAPSPEIGSVAGMSAPGEASAPAPLPPPVEVPAVVSGKQDGVCLVEHPLAGGTGFVIAKNLVATNAHVMEGAFLEEVKLHFSTPSAVTYKPKAIVYENVPEDLCLLEVEVDRSPIPLVADDIVPRGQRVFIIGNPSIAPGMTARNTIGAGTVSTVMHIEGFDFYQIDGNVNPGSSGGPALNDRGELVAIISMKAEDRVAQTIRDELRRLDEKFRAESEQGRGVGIAYSIPIVRVRTALAEAAKATEASKRKNSVLHHSRSLFQRATAVAVFNALRLEANVPQQVRDQAWKIRTAPRRPGVPRVEEVELMPANEANRLARLLDDKEVREGIRTAGKGLKERLDQLAQQQDADPEVIENLGRLLEAAEKAEEAAANPPKTYQRFAETIKGLRTSLKRTIPPLAERLEP